ncbi:enoyl-CoA hydratase/isomerase family protein [bacterium]|nr:enoyl-CoA hydratase/isomerase family protein [bacterium]
MESAFRLEDQSSRWNLKLWKLVFDLPGEKVNKFSVQVISEFEKILGEVQKKIDRKEIDALVLVSGKPGNFIAGADIDMFQTFKSAQDAESMSRMGQKLLDVWEDLAVPTVVGVNGTAMGGGCELSLASTAIVMSNDPGCRMGLPEVLLGLIPGMGGCVRMPRKVGLATAMELILSGKTLSGEKAAKAGLADAVIPKENFEDAVMAWTVANISKLKSGTRIARQPKLAGMGGVIGGAMEHTPFGRAFMRSKALKDVMSRSKGQYPAPLEAIDVFAYNGACFGPKLRGSAREKAMIREAQGFGKVAFTEVSKSLIRIFFLTEGVKKSQGLPPGKTVQAQDVRLAAVLGAGVMGGGIAQLFAAKDIPVRMKDLNVQALTSGVQAAQKLFKKQLKKRQINPREYLQKMAKIVPIMDYSGFHSVDAVVEAIVENVEIKRKVLQEMENYVGPKCILASNTSSLPITQLQAGMKDPSRMVGMHFFNPVHKMPLIEVIRGEQTSDEAVATIFQLSKKMGKIPIVVKDSPGFLVNRLLACLINEATWLLAEGVTVEEIDGPLKKFGMPMGALELVDEVGIDVGGKVAHILNDAFGSRMIPAPFIDKLIQAGYLGKKNGKGIFLWPKGVQKKNPALYEILGVTPSPGAVSAEDIVDRCILPMINEGTRCLEESIVYSPAELDLGMIMGVGFPPFRGGLMRYADTLGPKVIVERLRKFESRFGARFEPCKSLLSRAEHDQKFYTS